VGARAGAAAGVASGSKQGIKINALSSSMTSRTWLLHCKSA
jgi:hypothetical protein